MKLSKVVQSASFEDKAFLLLLLVVSLAFFWVHRAQFATPHTDALAKMMPVHSVKSLQRTIATMNDVGADELILVPASSDPELLARITDAVQ